MKKHTFSHALLEFLNRSPTAWHAVMNLEKELLKHEFIPLIETESWHLQPGKRYFLTRNDSSICAFITPLEAANAVKILASHTDSPSLKIKPQPEIRKQGAVLLSTEIYGAPLLSSWLNRDLGLAGRVVYLNQKNEMKTTLVNLTKHPMTIPQLAIHLDREVNEKGLVLNKQDHLNVLAALETTFPGNNGSYIEFLLKEDIHHFNELLNYELFLYPLEEARFLGFNQELLASYRIDSLASVYAAFEAFTHSLDPLNHEIKMITFWDNEEVGSGTAQGADSPFLAQTLERILLNFKQTREDYFKLLRNSLCLSIDLAHAVHPNYSDKHDSQHQPILGKGPVLKTNAQQRYASDALSSAAILAVAKRENLTLQKFVSRNDIPCGTTIGPIHASLLGMPTVDIGCGQLSMHSSRELMASQDYLKMIELLKSFLE